MLVLAVMEQVSERVCDDAGVSRLPRYQLIQLDQVVLSAVLRCPPRVSSATGARRRKRYLACSCTSSELVHIELVSEPVLNGAVVPRSPQSMFRSSRVALFSSSGGDSQVYRKRRHTSKADGGRRTADGPATMASSPGAWGTERETTRSRMLILQMRDLCLVSASLISFLPRTVHQVAVICRFALLGGTHKKTRGGG